MDLSAMIYGLSASGFFPSRAFLPAFLTAMLLRFGDDLPWLRNLPIIRGAADTPTWFTHGLTLVVLGLLAALEVIAAKNEDAEGILDGVDRYLKPSMAVLCCLGVLSVHDRHLLDTIATPAAQASLLDTAWLAGTGLLVNYLTGLRADLRLLLKAADEEDDFGLRHLLSWIEDAWATFGMLMVIIYPLVMLVFLAFTLGALRVLRWLLEKRERLHMAACAHCGHPISRSALYCPTCAHPHEQPMGVGFFGTSLETPAPDRDALALRLAEKRRCPRCATRLPQRHPRQRCVACQHDPFACLAFRQAYLEGVNRRLPRVLGLGLGLSLIPVIGLIPGVILCRQTLLSPFGSYLPGGRRFLARWLLRLVFVLLLTIHWIPGLGGIVVPLIGWLGFHLYRRTFVRLCGEPRGLPPAGTAIPPPLPPGPSAGTAAKAAQN